MPKKTIIGTVASTKMDKTAIVSVSLKRQHPVYKKMYLKTTRLAAENLIGAKEGDLVEMVETRPLSKTKRWKILRKLVAS